MGHGCSGHPIPNPVCTVAALKLSLREAGSTPDTPLTAIPHGSKCQWIHSDDITVALRFTARSSGPKLGLFPKYISARSMCTSGAVAFLLVGIDYKKIKLLGRWRSDRMMTYLHTSTRPILQQFVSVMVTCGGYAQVPAS